MKYEHTQRGYLMLVVLVVVLVVFVQVYLMALAEPPSYDSGPNLAVTVFMILILFLLASFGSLRVMVDKAYVYVRFGFGVYRKKFLLQEIVSVKAVRNHWYYGWGIRYWFWPKMWIFNVSGFDAVEIILKNGGIYRVGTDEPQKLVRVILSSLR